MCIRANDDNYNVLRNTDLCYITCLVDITQLYSKYYTTRIDIMNSIHYSIPYSC